LIEIEISVEDIDLALAEIVGRIENNAPGMQRVANVMLDAVEQNFAEEGRPKWADLAPSTKRQRAAKGRWPGFILQQTGRLASSVTTDSGNGYAAVGTNVEYAAIQQFGGTIRQYAQTRFVNFDSKTGRFARGGKANISQAVTYGEREINIPARPFLALADGDLEEIAIELGNWIAGVA
jgi:phage virion morphogenesis protein